jgi:hypothetical protein
MSNDELFKLFQSYNEFAFDTYLQLASVIVLINGAACIALIGLFGHDDEEVRARIGRSLLFFSCGLGAAVASLMIKYIGLIFSASILSRLEAGASKTFNYWSCWALFIEIIWVSAIAISLLMFVLGARNGIRAYSAKQ